MLLIGKKIKERTRLFPSLHESAIVFCKSFSNGQQNLRSKFFHAMRLPSHKGWHRVCTYFG